MATPTAPCNCPPGNPSYPGATVACCNLPGGASQKGKNFFWYAVGVAGVGIVALYTWKAVKP
jgi:hypothetical protein